MTRHTPLFPREPLDWRAVELPAWRTLSISAVAVGVAVGVPLRLLRAWALTHGGSGHDAAGPSFGYLVATFAVGALVLAGATTLHLAHFPVRRWPLRVLALAATIGAAEVITSAALIAVGREPLGTTGRAAWSDLPAIALSTALWRVVPLALFALLLAGVVQLVRTQLVRTQLARRSRHHLSVEHGELVADGRTRGE